MTSVHKKHDQDTIASIIARLPPVHPGEVLLHEFMEPLKLSAYRVADDIAVATSRVLGIIHGKRAVSADTALRLAAYFGTSVQFWMNLQSNYDVELAEASFEPIRATIRRIIPPAIAPRKPSGSLSGEGASIVKAKPANRLSRKPRKMSKKRLSRNQIIQA